jgi:hypothetical protein
VNIKKDKALMIPGPGCGDTRFISDSYNCWIEYEYHQQGEDFIGVIQFRGVVAYRFRNEMHSRGYLSEAYESIAIIDQSDWIRALDVQGPAGSTDLLGKKHFALLLTSNGYFELVADSYAILPSRVGLLE